MELNDRINIKKTQSITKCFGFWIKIPAVSYFRMGNPKLSSALSSFTSEFGMVSGGAYLLWSPGKSVGLTSNSVNAKHNLKNYSHFNIS